MCISVFIWQAHPLYPLLLLLNRDEFHNRPTKPVSWWEGCDILGGRDEVAGGTWLACTREGRLAFLTNVREAEPSSLFKGKSRGGLVVRFLESRKSPMEFAEEVKNEADEYNGFNLILTDICSRTMVYVSNRPKEKPISAEEVSPGIHVLSNAQLDTPWHKAKRLNHNFKELLGKYGEEEVPKKEMVEELMKDTLKDEESRLPNIRSPEYELKASSIFVDFDTPLGRYGTRSIAALSVTASGKVSFYEEYLEKETWKLMGSTLVQDASLKPMLRDHRPLKLNNDVYERVCQIPKKKGANFRDLRGVVVVGNKVEFSKSMERVLLSSGKHLVPDYAMSFMDGTSIKPFGRLWWDETVSTVVTRAEPHNQVIMHPEQDRVLSIRENARLQGFPDYYQLCGPVKARYIQVGNAVAVPVGRALGYCLCLACQGVYSDEPLLILPPKFSFFLSFT